ncbi:MAG: PocR ligand-binding domain-containing protein [Deltaproteobacteria bacterium]|jgi:ligand-binding sensor protein|nr:PocR ligand-binding domain-containing protein [Deltaproteobacteria bacterium]
MDTHGSDLIKLIDFAYLQKLQDTFARTFKVTALIVDEDCEPITEPSNRTDLCSLFSCTETEEDLCLDNVRNLSAQARDTGRPEIGICPHVGVATVAMPITINERFLGCWSFGQLRVAETPDEKLHAAAEEFNLSSESLRSAVQSLPLFTMREFERLFAFAESLVDSIVELGRKNLELAAQDKTIRDLRGRLEKREFFDAGTGLPNERTLALHSPEDPKSGNRGRRQPPRRC